MQMTILTGALVALGLSAATAQAASRDEVDKAKAEADAIIKEAHAEDLFENVTKDNVPTARHKLSGLQCAFEPGAKGNNIKVFEKPLPRGHDVSCGTTSLDFTETLFATRWATPVTIDQAVELVMADIRNVYPDLEPYKGAVTEMTMSPKPGGPTPPPLRTGRFVITHDGHSYFSRVAVSVVNGWIIEQRTSGPLDKVSEGDVAGGFAMIVATLEARDHPGTLAGPK